MIPPLLYTVEDNVLYAFWENEKEPLFTLAASYMTDNQGEMSQAVFLEIEKNILTVTGRSCTSAYVTRKDCVAQ